MPFGELLTDLDLTGDDLEPLRRDLIRGEHARASLAILGQQQLAEAEARIERAHVEGLGELQMRVDAGVYMRMALLFGPDCWRDEGFRADMLRKNPEMRIRSRARKLTLRVAGRSARVGTSAITTP